MNRNFLKNYDLEIENKLLLKAEGDFDAAGAGGDSEVAGADAVAAKPDADAKTADAGTSKSLLAEAKPRDDVTQSKAKTVDLLAGKYKNVDELVDGYKELTKKLTESGKIAPEKYELALPEGFSIENPESDPLLSSFDEVAKKHGLSQAAYNDLVAMKLQMDKQFAPDAAAEAEKLGANRMELLKGLDSWMTANFSDNEMAALERFAVTAENVMILDKMRKLAGSTIVPANVGEAAAPKRATPAAAEEALAKARDAEAKNAPNAVSLRAEAERMFKEAYPE